MRLICLSSGLTHKGSLREAGKIKETITYYTLLFILFLVCLKMTKWAFEM